MDHVKKLPDAATYLIVFMGFNYLLISCGSVDTGQEFQRLADNIVKVQTVFNADDKTVEGMGFISGERRNGKLLITTTGRLLHGENLDKRAKRTIVFLGLDQRPHLAKEIKVDDDENLGLIEIDRPVNFRWKDNYENNSPQINNIVGYVGQWDAENRWYIMLGGSITALTEDHLVVDVTLEEGQRPIPGGIYMSKKGIVGMSLMDDTGKPIAYPLSRIKRVLEDEKGTPVFDNQNAGLLNDFVLELTELEPRTPEWLKKVRATQKVWKKNQISHNFSVSSMNTGNYVLVKGGKFMPENEYEEELVDFYVCKYEVTISDLVLFLNEKGNGSEMDPFYDLNQNNAKIDTLSGKYTSISTYNNVPANSISWIGAIHFCNWLSAKHQLEPAYQIADSMVIRREHSKGFRLPTEEEWEYAASSGGDDVRFGNGKNQANPYEINFNGGEEFKESYSITGGYYYSPAFVYMFEPNDLGLFNMSGNVYEWCFSEKRRKNWNSMSSTMRRKFKMLRHYSPYTRKKIVKGGSYATRPSSIRINSARAMEASTKSTQIGFRVFRSR